MKTYNHYDDLPRSAQYIGSENGDGSMYAELREDIERAIAPVRLREPDGTYSYFETAIELNPI